MRAHALALIVLLLVALAIVASTEDRRDFWHMLRALAGIDEPEVSRGQIEDEVRQQVVAKITSGLIDLAAHGVGEKLD